MALTTSLSSLFETIRSSIHELAQLKTKLACHAHRSRQFYNSLVQQQADTPQGFFNRFTVLDEHSIDQLWSLVSEAGKLSYLSFFKLFFASQITEQNELSLQDLLEKAIDTQSTLLRAIAQLKHKLSYSSEPYLTLSSFLGIQSDILTQSQLAQVFGSVAEARIFMHRLAGRQVYVLDSSYFKPTTQWTENKQINNGFGFNVGKQQPACGAKTVQINYSKKGFNKFQFYCSKAEKLINIAQSLRQSNIPRRINYRNRE